MKSVEAIAPLKPKASSNALRFLPAKAMSCNSSPCDWMELTMICKPTEAHKRDGLYEDSYRKCIHGEACCVNLNTEHGDYATIIIGIRYSVMERMTIMANRRR